MVKLCSSARLTRRAARGFEAAPRLTVLGRDGYIDVIHTK